MKIFFILVLISYLMQLYCAKLDSKNKKVDKVLINICFFGDSLISKAMKFYNFTEKMLTTMEEYLPEYNYTINKMFIHYIEEVADGHIARFARKGKGCDAAILFWDRLAFES